MSNYETQASDATIALNDALLSLRGNTFTRDDLEVLLMAVDDEWPSYNVPAIMLELGEIVHEGDFPIAIRYAWDGSPDELADVLCKHRSYPMYVARHYPVTNIRRSDKRNEAPFWVPFDEEGVELARNVEMSYVRAAYDKADPRALWIAEGADRRQAVVVEICEERMRVDGTVYDKRLVDTKMYYPSGDAIRRR